MNYLLDTNICIYIINKKPSSVIKRIQTKQPEQIAISTITQAELVCCLTNSLNNNESFSNLESSRIVEVTHGKRAT
jgi:tRNA(fMet)-specific endonuclease VapC